MDLLSTYIIHHADNALILGHRNSEWTGHGPILEQDIAISNIALDLIGQARNFYQLAASRLNEIDPAQILTEDDLAYWRDAHEFRSFVLVEQSNGDWAKTILRQFFFSNWQYLIFEKLTDSKYPALAAIGGKSLKETRYHLKWSNEWVLRLGDGTAESHRRMLQALSELSPSIDEMFIPADFDYDAAGSRAGVNPSDIREAWYQQVNKILEMATLPVLSMDKSKPSLLSGKNGIHSGELDALLSEMQILQRTHPGNSW